MRARVRQPERRGSAVGMASRARSVVRDAAPRATARPEAAAVAKAGTPAENLGTPGEGAVDSAADARATGAGATGAGASGSQRASDARAAGGGADGAADEDLRAAVCDHVRDPPSPISVLNPSEDQPSDDEDVTPATAAERVEDPVVAEEVSVVAEEVRLYFNRWRRRREASTYWPPVLPSRQGWSDASHSAVIFNLDLSVSLKGELDIWGHIEEYTFDKVSFVAEQLSGSPTFVGVTEIDRGTIINGRNLGQRLELLLESRGHETFLRKCYPDKYEFIAHSWNTNHFTAFLPEDRTITENRGDGPSANTRSTDPSGLDSSGRFIWTYLKSTVPNSSVRMLLVTCHMPHRIEREIAWSRLCDFVKQNTDVTILLQGDTNVNPETLQELLVDGRLALDNKSCPNTTTARKYNKVIDNFVLIFPEDERERGRAAFEKNKYVRYRKTGYTNNHHVMELVFNPKLLETRRETPTGENASSS